MTTKPSHSEAEFFAREEAEKIHRLQEEQRRTHEKEVRDEEAHAHFMKCPKCGADLKTVRMGLVDVWECSACDTLVLDKAELQKVKTANSTLLKSLLDVFHK